MSLEVLERLIVLIDEDPGIYEELCEVFGKKFPDRARKFFGSEE